MDKKKRAKERKGRDLVRDEREKGGNRLKIHFTGVLGESVCVGFPKGLTHLQCKLSPTFCFVFSSFLMNIPPALLGHVAETYPILTRPIS